ncbi:MAG: hypothetical protein CMM56_00665 [Rhodospirillaceae bacterium]|nr:hypothetical protein [Rhodospirillaceae bacterium]
MTITFGPIKTSTDSQPFVECGSVDLSEPLAPKDLYTIREGLMKYGLIVFRGQRLEPEHEVRFNEAFGWHENRQSDFLFGFGAPSKDLRFAGGAQLPEWPQVSILGNVKIDEHHGIHNLQLEPRLGFTFTGWHADGLHDMFDGMPEMTTMYNPYGWRTTSGGRTYFTSGVKAIERMEPQLLKELEKCFVSYMRCANDDDPDPARNISPGPALMTDEGTKRVGFAKNQHDPSQGLHTFRPDESHAKDGGIHPCIRIHPLTGQKSLYVTPSRAVHLVDRETGKMRHDTEETAELLSKALLPSAIPNVRYEHKWLEGDLVAWTNTLVLHSASDPHDIIGDRLIHRVRLSTPKTRWKDGRYTDS